MKPLSKYFSVELGNAFAATLPQSQKIIGSAPFNPQNPKYGVGGNTFRAYTGWLLSPSKTYRQWAEPICRALDPSSLGTQLSTAQGFQFWHSSLADSLQAHWIANQGRPLSFAHQHKLIDLFVKWLSRHEFPSSQLSQALVDHANCALDSQTLSKLNECLSFALPISKPSMGDVHSGITYVFCQDLISDFATHFGGSRLLFDYFAWKAGGEG